MRKLFAIYTQVVSNGIHRDKYDGLGKELVYAIHTHSDESKVNSNLWCHWDLTLNLTLEIH